MVMFFGRAALACTLASWLFALAAAAQEHDTAETAPDGYRALIDEAVHEYTAGRMLEARALFSRAHALFPNARTLRGLGATEFELRDYGQSVSHLEAALASKVRPLEGELLERTEHLLARARGFVARIKLTIQPNTGVVTLDGVPVAANREVLLPLGDHTVEAVAPGYVPQKRPLHVRGGEASELVIVLSVRVEAMPAGQIERPSHPWLRSPWLWTGVALAAAGVATALAVTLPRDRYNGGTLRKVVGD